MEDKSELSDEDMQLIIKRYNQNIIGLNYLTGDLNKKAFENKLRELKFVKKSSVLKVTINSADDLIEHYGKDIYELIQIEVSNRLAKIIKILDIVAKISNNEFGIIIYCSSKLCRYLTIRAINKQLNKAFVIDELKHPLNIKVNILLVKKDKIRV